jgi:hypothetical protein
MARAGVSAPPSSGVPDPPFPPEATLRRIDCWFRGLSEGEVIREVWTGNSLPLEHLRRFGPYFG